MSTGAPLVVARPDKAVWLLRKAVRCRATDKSEGRLVGKSCLGKRDLESVEVERGRFSSSESWSSSLEREMSESESYDSSWLE